MAPILIGHCITDEDEMLEKFTRDILVYPPVLSQLERDVEHTQRVERHPPC